MNRTWKPIIFRFHVQFFSGVYQFSGVKRLFFCFQSVSFSHKIVQASKYDMEPKQLQLILMKLSLPKLQLILMMAEILHHLVCMKPCKYWDKLHINWCRISSINSMSVSIIRLTNIR